MEKTNDITKLEGVRDFYKQQVYGDVFNYICEKQLLQNPDDVVCRTAFDLLEMADALPVVYLSDKISESEKKRLITQGMERMEQKLSTLQDIINPDAKDKDSQKSLRGEGNGN